MLIYSIGTKVWASLSNLGLIARHVISVPSAKKIQLMLVHILWKFFFLILVLVRSESWLFWLSCSMIVGLQKNGLVLDTKMKYASPSLGLPYSQKMRKTIIIVSVKTKFMIHFVINSHSQPTNVKCFFLPRDMGGILILRKMRKNEKV